MRHTLAVVMLAASLVTFCRAGVMAQEMSVSSLLKEGYEIAGIIPSNAGPGIFLKKGDTLIACFVAEKPGSPSITTQYCKPVR